MASPFPAPQGQQVDPSQAQGAQIPLQSFTLPQFPPQALGLRALTLTSDIKLDEYQNLLSEPFTVPQLPPSIESLTLELFSLGYPPGFLKQVADRLPYLKSLVVYSQLFGGISNESTDDAITFFDRLKGLRALHLLDVFARPHFFDRVGEYVTYNGEQGPQYRRGLMFLEVNYTFRHNDEEFLPKIQATELPSLVGPGLISCCFNVSAEEDSEPSTDEAEKENTKEGAKEGVMAFNKTLAPHLVSALTDEEKRPQGLKVLNCTLYTLGVSHLASVLKVQTGLMVLNATIEVDPTEECKKALMDALENCKNLEQVEIVGNPSLQFFMAVSNPRGQALEKAFPSKEDMEKLGERCAKLTSFKASILRTTSMGTAEWTKADGTWKGGITAPDADVAAKMAEAQSK
ncbi:hypothetical protein LTR50_007431 [Elasticomyces elasticus]|nr:hypothetical protein LTR50_007431 [Elasticomyces elasticus]